MSTLKNDLALFNKLAEVLINEEQNHPVAERIEANQLYDTLLTFALEGNVSIYEENIGDEILYLQRLVLEGR